MVILLLFFLTHFPPFSRTVIPVPIGSTKGPLYSHGLLSAAYACISMCSGTKRETSLSEAGSPQMLHSHFFFPHTRLPE